MQVSTSGFHKAPVSKAVIAITTLISLAISATHNGFYLSITSKALFVRFEYWRILSYQCCFSTAGELVVGLALLYQFRLFERHWGSRKFGTFLVLSYGISAILGCCALLLAQGMQRRLDALPLGPYGPIFSLLVQWFFDIPVSHSVSLMGIPVSDKSFCYLLAVQLAMTFQPASFVAAGIGTLVGLIYRMSPLRRLLLPKSVCTLFGKIVLPIIETAPRPAAQAAHPTNQEREIAGMFENDPAMQQAIYGMLAENRRLAGGVDAALHPAPGPALHRRAAAQPANRQATDTQMRDAMEMLAGMGFADTARNQRLLAQFGGNVQRVLDELLR
jgi:hypothetical protein